MDAPSVGRVAPTLAGRPIIGSLLDVRRDYLGTIARAAREVGGLARVVAGPPGWRITLYVIGSPELAAEVLSRPDRFGKNAPGYRELRSALGDNLLTSQDEIWHRQRRFLAPIFTRRRIVSAYAPVMIEEAGALVERWRRAAAEGRTLDAYPEMISVSARISGRILFGADMTRALELLTRFRIINDQLLRRAVSPHPAPPWLPSPANRRLRRGLAEVRAIVDQLIDERRAQGPTGADDMLSLLLGARDAENEADRLSDDEVADQIMLFLLAGHDTTSVTLACTLVQLAVAPDWQQIVQDEVDGVLGDSPAGVPAVDRLLWTTRVIREAMRLYPAAHGMARSARGDQFVDGYRIPDGAWVEVSPWAVHHAPSVWADPERFDPRRFDLPPGEHPGGHRNAWFPFGAGPRACIGMQLAMLEVQLVVAAVAHAFTVSTPLVSAPVHAAITLLPSGELPITLSERTLVNR